MLFADPVEEWKWHVRKNFGIRKDSRARRISSWVFPIASVLIFLGAIAARPKMPTGVLVVVLLMIAAMPLRNAFRQYADSRSGVTELVNRASVHLRKGEYDFSVRLAQRGLAIALTPHHRETLHRTLAFAAIGARNPFLAHGALLKVQPESLGAHVLCAYLACCNRKDEAMALFREGREHGVRDAVGTKLLIEVLIHGGEVHFVREILRDDCALTADERSAIDRALSRVQNGATESEGHQT